MFLTFGLKCLKLVDLFDVDFQFAAIKFYFVLNVAKVLRR